MNRLKQTGCCAGPTDDMGASVSHLFPVEGVFYWDLWWGDVEPPEQREVKVGEDAPVRLDAYIRKTSLSQPITLLGEDAHRKIPGQRICRA